MRVFLLLCISFLIISCDSEENNNDVSNTNDSMISASLDITNNESNNQDDIAERCKLLNISASQRDELLLLNDTSLSNEVLSELNKHRASQGKKELTFNEDLLVLGIQHNQYQIAQDDISHDFGDDRFCTISSVLPVFSFAENTAFGFDTAQKVLNALLESPSHRRNIEGDFDSMATAVSINTNGVHFYTQIFIKLQ